MRAPVRRGLCGAGTARLAAALAALVALAPAAAAGERTEVVEKHEAVLAKGDRVHVSGTSGAISVTASPDSVLRVLARKIAEGGTPAERESLIADHRVRFGKEGGTVRVVAERVGEGGVAGAVERFLRGGGLSGGPRGWIDFEVRVPRGTRLEAGVTSGRISVVGTEGDAELSATSGDIEVARASGRLALSTTSGDIALSESEGDVEASLTSGNLAMERVRGDLRAHLTSGDAVLRDLSGAAAVSATSGDVTLAGCAGPIEVSVTSGSVEVDRSAADVAVESSSGDVVVRAAALGERGIEIQSTSGSVSVAIPRSCGARLDLATASGAIRADGRLAVSAVSRRNLEAKVDGAGDASVSVRTSSGDIEIVLSRSGASERATRRGAAKR